MACDLPIRSEMCATCPFRPGVAEKYRALLPHLTQSALTEATRICHSTGRDNAFHRRTGKPESVCRGARDVQLKAFAASGFLPAPTDEAWNAQRVRMGMLPQVVLTSPPPDHAAGR